MIVKIIKSTQPCLIASLAVTLWAGGLAAVNAGEPDTTPHPQTAIPSPLRQRSSTPAFPPVMADNHRDRATRAAIQGIKDRAEAFVDALTAAHYEQAWTYLHPILQAEISPARIEQKWESLLRRTGPFERRLNTQTQRNLVIIKAKFGRTTDDLFLVFDNAGRIYSVDFPATEADDLFGEADNATSP